MKETFKEAGYKHFKNVGYGQHILINRYGKYELFFCNKNHASWGLIYKNTHLEFNSTVRSDSPLLK
jgi:hypothetical protein